MLPISPLDITKINAYNTTMDDYDYLLDPQLYNDEYVKSFVEELLELNIPSEDHLNDYISHLIPLDSVMDHLDTVIEAAKSSFNKTGLFNPSIVAIDKNKILVNAESMPTTQTEMFEFIAKIKTFAFLTGSQMIFCSYVCYHRDGIISLSSDDFQCANLGINTVGSFIKNNKISALNNISENSFEEINRNVTRDKDDSMGCFYKITDIDEFEQIVKFIPSFANKFPGDNLDLEYMNNFATVMAAASKFNCSQ